MFKNIIVVGLVGYNLGDEAIAVSVAKYISTNNSVRVVVLKKGVLKKYGIKEVYFNPRSVSSWIKLFFYMVSSRKVLFGGGSLIQDKLGGGRIRGVMGYLNLTTLLAKLASKKIYSLPIGIDELRPENYTVAKKILGRFESVYVRDNMSYENAIKYAGDDICNKLSIIPDPAYLIESVKVFGGERYVTVCLAKENSMVVGDKVYVGVVSLIRQWLDDGIRVYLIAMDCRNDDELTLYKEMQAEVDNDRVSVVIPNSVSEVATILASSSGLLGMRLHAMILSLGIVPIYCISRTTKTLAFCIENEIPHIHLDGKSNLDNWYSNVSDELFRQNKKLNFNFDVRQANVDVISGSLNKLLN